MRAALVDVNYKTVLAVGAVGALAVWWISSKAGEAAKAAGDALNPLSETNLPYRGANALARAVSSTAYAQKNRTVGGTLFDWINGTDTQNGDFITNNPYMSK